MKLSRDLWLQVEPLLNTALDMDASERVAWLERVDTTHPEAAPLLRRMLETHERAERARELETVPRLAPAPEWSSAYAPGTRIGPFELLRPLGHGGMGEVWLARQADGRVEREVALKLPALHQSGETWRERFRRERDILARLVHPNIARLYDAGVTESGQPWLAMEFVEGHTLSAYVTSRSLTLPQRLALFRQVLAAVSHAHRHLVVHRDLKPPNILIDTSGQVKLLDFGIAKLVDAGEGGEGSGDLTRLGGRVMTLRYAAPEQVDSGAITTATDIYSLGVVLQELLTGLAPYRAVREGRSLTEAMLLREEIAVPSTLAIPKPLARALSGDLDAILLKAMRRDPVARYASVELFDQDILAYLERRPVKARAGTWRYLAGRFAVRHKLPLATGAAVVVALGAGLFLADRERRIAVAEKARAERHFASVRKLANTFIFDVNAEIEGIPGSLKAREMLVKTSLEYLDTLSAEAGDDPVLMAELAGAYRDIGNIQGMTGGSNIGKTALAQANYEKSKRLFAAVDAVRPTDAKMLRGYWTLSYLLARSYALSTNPAWKPEIETTVKLAERLVALPDPVLADRSRLAMSYAEQASLTNMMVGQTPETEAQVVKAIGLLEALVRENPTDVGLRENLVSNYQRGGLVFFGARRTPESARKAIEYHRKALALVREILREKPSAVRMRPFEVSTLGAISEMQSYLGEHREADRTIAEALPLGKDAYERDAKDVSTVIAWINLLTQACYAADAVGDGPRAIRFGRESMSVVARLPEEARKTTVARNAIAGASSGLGTALVHAAESAKLDREARLAMLREARPLLKAALTFSDEYRAETGNVYEDEVKAVNDTLRRGEELAKRIQRG
ncbi:hypothetical protein BWI17_21920 [Betaproteobacteria bacterium GR16-43]|nr:hypothetical protein BWI17_21920 [Betaproteobacteria bacterium GR16-43]